MSGHRQPFDAAAEFDWRRRRDMARKGHKDLLYLPRSRCGWNATLSALAWSARRQVENSPDLNLWAVMQGCPASARYAELGRSALVLWHGTSARRAEKIREVGLFPKKGVWATAEPALAHGFTRGRATEYSAGSAMIVLVFDREDIPVPFEMASEKETLRFRRPVRPEFIEYVLWDDRIDFVGRRRARLPRAWGAGRFKRVSGRWVPRSRPPVRFEGRQAYSSLDEWLELSIRRVLTALGKAAGIEIFSSLYSTIDPTDALPHEAVFEALERLCGAARPQRRSGNRLFRLRDEEARRG
jgi:hypothetical protein